MDLIASTMVSAFVLLVKVTPSPSVLKRSSGFLFFSSSLVMGSFPTPSAALNVPLKVIFIPSASKVLELRVNVMVSPLMVAWNMASCPFTYPGAFSFVTPPNRAAARSVAFPCPSTVPYSILPPSPVSLAVKTNWLVSLE